MRIEQCRVCHHDGLEEILDLGEQHLSDFRSDSSLPPTFPLTLLLCTKCSLVQLSETVDRENMYHDGYGYRSGVNEQIRRNLKMLVNKAIGFVEKPGNWLDIACNDGTLLSMVPQDVFRVGVDPVKKFKVESELHADLIVDDYFPSNQLSNEFNFDVITSISMFYDLDDPNQFVSTIADYLARKGIWVVQQNYLVSMIKNLSFDNVCHEHIEYYSLTAMNYLIERHNLEIINVFEDVINGGSIITIIAHQGEYVPDESVSNYLKMESEFGVIHPSAYANFRLSVDDVSKRLYELISKLKSESKSVSIYGASTRGAVIWQKAGLDFRLIDNAVERQEEKFGKFFSAISVPIISEYEMRKNPPDYLLIGPWFLRESFVAREVDFLKNGGKMIFPLPEIEIIEG